MSIGETTTAWLADSRGLLADDFRCEPCCRDFTRRGLSNHNVNYREAGRRHCFDQAVYICESCGECTRNRKILHAHILDSHGIVPSEGTPVSSHSIASRTASTEGSLAVDHFGKQCANKLGEASHHLPFCASSTARPYRCYFRPCQLASQLTQRHSNKSYGAQWAEDDTMDVQRTNKLRLQEGKIACREMYSLPSTDACDAGSTLGPNRRSMTPIHGLAMFDWILSYLKVRAFVSPWDAEFLFESLLTDGEKQQAEGILNVLKNARSADMAQHLCTLLDGTAFEELIMAYAGIKTWALRLADDLDERSEIDSMGACDVLAAMILHLQALEDSILQDTLTLDDIEANMMRMFAAGMFYMPQGPEDVDFDLIADGDVAAMLSALRSKLVMRLGSTSDQDNATLLRTAGHHLTEVGRLAKYLEALRMTSV